MDREIKTNLSEILSLISCARDYGFERDILFDSFKDMLGNKLTNEEIDWFSKETIKEDGFTKDDFFEIKNRLLEFKNKYIKNERN